MTNIVAITGAGISKASNIPTFVEMRNIRDKLTRNYFRKNPKDFYESILVMKNKIDKAEPNDAHMALFEYDVPIITMNIDGLHTKAGSKKTLEVHGNLKFVFCKKCKEKYNFDVVKKSINCPKCGEIIESNVVLYGDKIRNFIESLNLVNKADRLLVVGTSFYTSTVNQMVYEANKHNIPVDIINEYAETKVRKYLEEIYN